MTEQMRPKEFVIVQIPGRPIAKGRPRFTQSARGVHVFTPARTADWEAVVQAEMRKVCPHPLEGPLELSVSFNFHYPRNWPKAKREAAEEGELFWYEGKPDLDNLVKLVKDAGNGIIWRDDAQVVKLEADKCYSVENETVINVFPAHM